MRVTYILSVLLVVSTGGCSAFTLAPAIVDSTTDYNKVVEKASDAMLLRNVLRASEHAPLSISELSAINGALSLQASVGLSDPFGRGPVAKNVATPSLSLGSTPTFTVAPRNTEGFTLNIMQPVPPSYLLNNWHTEFDQTFLLLVFIKWMKIDGQELYNNPDSPSLEQFVKKIQSFKHLRIRSFTVLEPIGSPYVPKSISSVATSQDPSGHPVTNKSQIADPIEAARLQGYQFLTGLGDVQYHVGNAGSVDESGHYPNLQLYRSYPAQVAICVDGIDLGDETESDAADHVRAAAPAAAGPSSPAAGKAGSTSSAASAAGAPGGGAAQPGITAVLQANRTSAILDNKYCDSVELVSRPTTEELFQKKSKTFAQVEWRSTAEIFRYLGAVLRNGGRPKWVDSDGTVHNVFSAAAGGAGPISAEYMGRTYAVPPENTDPMTKTYSHSMSALTILTELVNVASVSSDIPVTQPFQIIP